MHQEEVDIGRVVDEEGLVAGRHHVAGFLVGAVADLDIYHHPSVPATV